MWVLCLVLFVLRLSFGDCQNCRGEEYKPRECENLCDKNGECVLRAALLLPRNTEFDVSVSAVEPVIDLALQDPVVKEVFPPWLKFEMKSYDVTNCDSAYAVISSIDAYNDCTHVFFGPACDYALASVARIAKFLGNTGTPLVTTGGFTFDFVMPKQHCDHEYFMLVRTGLLGFMDLGYFLIDIMRHYNWQQLLLINEPEAQVNIAGKSTCHLMVKTFANFLKKEDIVYSPWDTTSDGGRNYTENLKFYLGYKYTSKYEWGRVVILYESSSFVDIVGDDGGFLVATTIHRFMIIEGMSPLGREIFNYQNMTEILLESVGYDYGSYATYEQRFHGFVYF